ncbi:MAG: VWA domain-containing protein [Pseudomonadota bacterium]
MKIPRGAETFVEFASLLREHRFAVSPDQTMGFIEAIALLGPKSMNDIRASAIAMLAVPKDREPEFDVLFQSHFYGQTLAPTVAGDEEDDLQVREPGTQSRDISIEEEEDQPGEIASGTEILSHRGFAQMERMYSLELFSRQAKRRLPKRMSYRFKDAKRRRKLNMRELLKSANKTDGDAVILSWLDRKVRQRKILLLIDVSGSMRDLSDGYMRFAHALSKAANSFECFTLGTRLTRITNSLKPREPGTALLRISQSVADFDGGTRIGDALGAYLSIPRYAGHAKGALVLILSDGLERGDPGSMIDAVERLQKMSWRLHWLSPLASDKNYVPETEALKAILPHLDELAGAADLKSICDHVLNIARAA